MMTITTTDDNVDRMGMLELSQNIISNEDAGVFVCNREGGLGPETWGVPSLT